MIYHVFIKWQCKCLKLDCDVNGLKFINISINQAKNNIANFV